MPKKTLFLRTVLFSAVAIAAFLLVPKLFNDKEGSEPSDNISKVPQQKAKEPSKGSQHLIEVKNSEPVGGFKTVKAKRGERIKITIRSLDKSGPSYGVHLHGYQLTGTLAPGKSVNLNFKADIEGLFEIELHSEPEKQLGELEVTP